MVEQPELLKDARDAEAEDDRRHYQRMFSEHPSERYRMQLLLAEARLDLPSREVAQALLALARSGGPLTSDELLDAAQAFSSPK